MMARKFNKFQKKTDNNYKFIFSLIGIGLLILGMSLFNNTFNPTEVKTSSGTGSSKGSKSFQPTDSQKDVPGKLMWGRDF